MGRGRKKNGKQVVVVAAPSRSRSRSGSRSRRGAAQGYIGDVVVPMLKAEAKKGLTKLAKKAASAAIPLVEKAAGAVTDKLRKFATAENAYLYGFLDPENAAAGPGDSQYSTYVVHHRSFTDLTIHTLAADPKSGFNYLPLDSTWTTNCDAYLNGSPNNAVFTDSAAYRSDVGDPITFVATPHYVRSFRGTVVPDVPADATIDPYISRMSSGYVCNQQFFDQGMYSNRWSEASGALQSADGGWMKPLKTYDIEPYSSKQVGMEVAKDVTSSDYISRNVSHLVRHRLCGLKIRVECNAPALTVTGQVVGGDNRFLYGVPPETVARNNNGNGSERDTANLLYDIALAPGDDVYNGQTMSQSRMDLGSLSHKGVYESCFVPTSDKISVFSSITANQSALTSVAASSADSEQAVWAGYSLNGTRFAMQRHCDFLMNNPVAYITVTGAPDGTSFRVYTTASYEYVVLNDNPLALVRDSARLNARFQPNWGLLAVVKSACCGDCENVAKACLTVPQLAHGLLAAAGLLPREVGLKIDAETYSIGVHNAALSLVNSPAIRRQLDTAPNVGAYVNTVNRGSYPAARPTKFTTGRAKASMR